MRRSSTESASVSLEKDIDPDDYPRCLGFHDSNRMPRASMTPIQEIGILLDASAITLAHRLTGEIEGNCLLCFRPAMTVEAKLPRTGSPPHTHVSKTSQPLSTLERRVEPHGFHQYFSPSQNGRDEHDSPNPGNRLHTTNEDPSIKP